MFLPHSIRDFKCFKEPFHKHPVMGTYRSGQREHFKNGLNIAIKRGLFILNHSLWILDNVFSCLGGYCFALLLIKIAAWLVNATSLLGRVDFTLWPLSQRKQKATLFRFTASGHLTPMVAPVKMTAGQFVQTHIHAVAVQWTGATTLPLCDPYLALVCLQHSALSSLLPLPVKDTRTLVPWKLE